LRATMIVARDIVHAELRDRLGAGEGLPDYVKDHPIYYAGPAKTPEDMPSGSFGQTTSSRMDSYVRLFQEAGGSMIMLGKGNRSAQVKPSCAELGGFYLGSIGGPAARLAQDCITDVEVGGMEDFRRGLPGIHRHRGLRQRLLAHHRTGDDDRAGADPHDHGRPRIGLTADEWGQPPR